MSVLIAASPVSANSAERFSTAEQNKVLRAIDDVCGDTWCEGDYDFRFNKFACDQKNHTCELNFQFIKTDDGEKRTFSAEQVCHFENINSFRDLMESKWSLNDDFYSAVTDCIWEKEKSVQF